VRKPHETGEICVQLTKLRTVHWENSGARRYRFDRLPLSHSCRTALKSVLANARAKGPDDDGWFIAELPDGGSVQICLRRLDDDPDLDAGTVVLRRLTPEAAQLVHRLMSVGHLILLPLAITSSTTEAQTVTVPWPHVRVVESPLELYDILTRGPYEWWSNQRGEADRQETS
jgi:hypothetical protein